MLRIQHKLHAVIPRLLLQLRRFRSYQSKVVIDSTETPVPGHTGLKTTGFIEDKLHIQTAHLIQPGNFILKLLLNIRGNGLLQIIPYSVSGTHGVHGVSIGHGRHSENLEVIDVVAKAGVMWWLLRGNSRASARRLVKRVPAIVV